MSDKTRITFYMSQKMVERAKNAVFWTPGLTLSSLAEQSLEHLIDKLEEKRGEPFPLREAELAKGRPSK